MECLILPPSSHRAPLHPHSMIISRSRIEISPRTPSSSSNKKSKHSFAIPTRASQPQNSNPKKHKARNNQPVEWNNNFHSLLSIKIASRIPYSSFVSHPHAHASATSGLPTCLERSWSITPMSLPRRNRERSWSLSRTIRTLYFSCLIIPKYRGR